MKVNHPHFTDMETVETLRNLLNVTQLVSHRIHIQAKHLPSASSFKKSGARTLSSSQRSTNNLLCYLRQSHHLSGPQFLHLAKTFYEPIHTFMPFSSPNLQFLDVTIERNAMSQRKSISSFGLESAFFAGKNCPSTAAPQ